MDFSLTHSQQTLREQVLRFAQLELTEGASLRDREQTFSRDLWQACGRLRLQGLPVPEQYGGRGLDPLSCAVALEALGHGCHDAGLVFCVGAHLLACVVPIWKHGSEDQRRRWLPKLCDGSLVAANAMTEPGAGSDISAITTRAVPEGSGFRLNGAKALATNAPIADLAIVFAAAGADAAPRAGLTAFLVETASPGFQALPAHEKMGHRTAPVGGLLLTDVYVPAEAVLGGVGAGMAVFNDAMNWERICLFASHVGVMERLLEKAIQQARKRSQFGRPIGKFQAVSHKIVDMKVRLEAARLLVYKAASRLDRSRGVALDASIAKLFVSESLVKSALDVVQVHGGAGYFTQNEVERALRDAVGSTLYSGTSEIQRNIIAGWLGL